MPKFESTLRMTLDVAWQESSMAAEDVDCAERKSSS